MTEAANNRPTEPGASLLSVLAGESQTQQSAPASASAMDHPDYVPDPDFQLRGAFSNQMIDAAMPLFGLVMRLRKQESHRDIPFLYNAVYNQINAIVEEMRRYDYEPAQLQAHSYALCLYIDEAVMSTPWGKSSLWSQKPLLSVFHHETWGGEKIFTVLSRMMQEPKRYQDVLEFIYLCLCLGLRGKYGIDPKGDEALQALILKLREIILELRGPPRTSSATRWPTSPRETCACAANGPGGAHWWFRRSPWPGCTATTATAWTCSPARRSRR